MVDGILGGTTTVGVIGSFGATTTGVIGGVVQVFIIVHVFTIAGILGSGAGISVLLL